MSYTRERLALTSQDDQVTGCANFESRSGVDAIVMYHENAKADARRVVLCWNEHDDLVETLSLLVTADHVMRQLRAKRGKSAENSDTYRAAFREHALAIERARNLLARIRGAREERDASAPREIRIVVDGGNKFDVFEGERHTDDLTWDEMLGTIAELTHPRIGGCRYRMQTPAEWQAERDRRAARRQEAGS
jgi:hypothetical protein